MNVFECRNIERRYTLFFELRRNSDVVEVDFRVAKSSDFNDGNRIVGYFVLSVVVFIVVTVIVTAPRREAGKSGFCGGSSLV